MDFVTSWTCLCMQCMWHAFLELGKSMREFWARMKSLQHFSKEFFFSLSLLKKLSFEQEGSQSFSRCEFFFLARNLFFSKENRKWASVKGFWQGFLCFLFSHFFGSISHVLAFCVLFSIFGASIQHYFGNLSLFSMFFCQGGIVCVCLIRIFFFYNFFFVCSSLLFKLSIVNFVREKGC